MKDSSMSSKVGLYPIAKAGLERNLNVGTRADRGETDFSQTRCQPDANSKQHKTKAQNMKTMNKKNLMGAGVAIAMALAAWLPTTASAADETKPMKPMKGGEHQMMLNKSQHQAGSGCAQNRRQHRDGVRQVQDRVGHAREARSEGCAASDGERPNHRTDRHPCVQGLQFHH